MVIFYYINTTDKNYSRYINFYDYNYGIKRHATYVNFFGPHRSYRLIIYKNLIINHDSSS